MAYLILAKDKTDLRIDVDHFSDHLRNSWSEVEIRKPVLRNDLMVLEWKLRINADIPLGLLHSDLKTISIDAFPDAAAKFAVWFREYIPSDCQLFLYHDSSELEIELTPNTSEAEVLEELLQM